MLSIIGFIDGKDPKMLSTIDATMDHLVVNGMCYRYVDAPEGLSGKEATFILCTFWLVSALVLAGRVEEARRIFDNMLSKASPLGLFAEEYEPKTGEQIGNLPAGLLAPGSDQFRDLPGPVRRHRQGGARRMGRRENIRSTREALEANQRGEAAAETDKEREVLRATVAPR